MININQGQTVTCSELMELYFPTALKVPKSYVIELYITETRAV